MTQKLLSKKEFKSIYGVPYRIARTARLEAAGRFPPSGYSAKLAESPRSRDKVEAGSGRRSPTAIKHFLLNGQSEAGADPNCRYSNFQARVQKSRRGGRSVRPIVG